MEKKNIEVSQEKLDKEEKVKNSGQSVMLQGGEPAKLVDFKVKKVIDKGSFGKVCKCISKISGFERAVKFIKKKSIDDPKEVQRFQGEVNILEQMDH